MMLQVAVTDISQLTYSREQRGGGVRGSPVLVREDPAASAEDLGPSALCGSGALRLPGVRYECERLPFVSKCARES